MISDYSAIEETIKHGVSEDKKMQHTKQLQQGVDIDMMSNVYAGNLKQLVEEKLISEELIDDAVLRVFKIKKFIRII